MSTADPLAKVQTVTMPAAAAALKISTRSLYRHIAAGKFPRPIKLGRSTRVPLRDLERIIAGGQFGRAS